jgi:hypothetical protein
MDLNLSDLNRSFMLDGNAAAGILDEIFATDMTANQIQCGSCGREGELGTLLAFTQAPGLVLRCPACENILLRIVQLRERIYLDLRGAAYLSLQRASTG